MTWQTTRLKNVANIRVSNVDKKSLPDEQKVRLCNYVDVYKNGQITPEMPLMKATASTEQIRTFQVRTGDTIVTKDSEDPEDIAVPAYVAESAPDMVCGYHLALVRPTSQVLPKYLYWALASSGFSQQMSASATGITRFGLRQESIACGEVPFPSYAEQRRIADFLDAETARIDRLYLLRRRGLALLRERTNTLLDLMVRGAANGKYTRQARYAPLGEIPERWGETRLRNVDCEVQTGPFGSQLHAEAYISRGWPVINPANIRPEGLVADHDVTIDSSTRERLSRHVLHSGDVVFGRRGELGRAGVVAPDQEGWVCGTGCLRVRFHRDAYHSGYLRRYLSIPALRHYFKLHSIGSTMDNLNSVILLAMPLLLPEMMEQKAISRDCDEVERHAAEQAGLFDRQLELLAERREALITAAVTGEFDVSAASGRGVVE